MRYLFFILCFLIISCKQSLDFCNTMDSNSNCYEEPNTELLNDYDFEGIIDNTDIFIHVGGNNTPAGFSYNLDDNYWIDTTNIQGIIKLYNLSEGTHTILIRSYYPEGDFDPSPLNLGFIIDAINVNFHSESCPTNSINSNILEYKFTSDSFINNQKTNLFSNIDITYIWEFRNTEDTLSYITNKIQSPCYQFNQDSGDTTYYDVTLSIDTEFSIDILTKSDFLTIPPSSIIGPGGF